MVQNKKIHVCPICGFVNEPNVDKCGKCGVAVTAGTTTVNVPDEAIEQALDTQHFGAKHRGIVKDGLILYIAGETQPLVLQQTHVILGRQVDGEPADVIDTTSYYGHLLGVSRQHAEIMVTSDGCTLVDLNSTNGTFLNEKRLLAHTSYLIHNGDQIRLGQLIMFVYFSSTSTRQQVRFQPTAAASLPASRKLTASHLAVIISTYLDSLLTLQQTINTLLQRDKVQAIVSTIHINAEDSCIDVNLEGVLDAMHLVQKVLIPWQVENPAAVAALRQKEQLSTPQTPAESDSTQALLAQSMLKNLSDGTQTPDADRLAEYQEPLLAQLQILAASPLEIVDITF